MYGLSESIAELVREIRERQVELEGLRRELTRVVRDELEVEAQFGQGRC